MQSFSFSSILIYLMQETQIALLTVEELKIPAKYLDFLDFSSKKRVLIILETINLNQYTIEFQKSHQLSYRLIYSLDLIKL